MASLEKILNEGASSEEDLHKLAESVGLDLNFIGSMFDLPKKLNVGKYIMLIHPSREERTGHWIAIDVWPNEVLYFDSYGQPPPQRVVASTKKPIYYNNKQIQALNHSHCGVYSIYFLMTGARGLKRFRVINSF